jgi:hypothetical protein
MRSIFSLAAVWAVVLAGVLAGGCSGDDTAKPKPSDATKAETPKADAPKPEPSAKSKNEETKTASSDFENVEVILRAMKDKGFTRSVVFAKFNIALPVSQDDVRVNVDLMHSELMLEGNGGKIVELRRLGSLDVPSNSFQLAAKNDVQGRKFMEIVAALISQEHVDALRKALKSYDQASVKQEVKVGKLSIHVGADGVGISSVPGVIPGATFFAWGLQ